MSLLRINIWEINRSPLLNYFGALLSVIHLINYYFWQGPLRISQGSAKLSPTLCWDFFANCQSAVGFSPTIVNTLFTAYLVMGALGVIFFVWKRFVGISWACLFAATCLHLFFYILDASLASDFHALLIFLELSFLFVPNKISCVRIGVISFYLISVLRELNSEWLSGATLVGTMPMPQKGLEWVAATSVIAKLTLPLLLLSGIGQRVALGILGLFAFHGFYFYFMRDFTSAGMLLLLVFFVLNYFEQSRLERESLYQSYAHPEPSKLWWPAFIFIFWLAQTAIFKADWPTQILKIQGPAASSECYTTLFAQFKGRLEQKENIVPPDINPALRCHPLVIFNSAKSLCPQMASQENFNRLAVYLFGRSLSEKDFSPILQIANICEPGLTYKKVAK